MKKIALFFVLLLMVISTNAQIFKKKPKKEVPGKEVVLTRHPDEVILKGKDKADYYLFFSLDQKCLLITDKKSVYDSVSSFLPLRSIPGREVKMDGPGIDPFTIFTKSQLEETSQRVGFAINRYNTFRIFNTELIQLSVEPVKKDQIDAPATQPAKKTW